ncbi:MAG TPA: ATP-dependent DNA ligase [Solirubrobacteraceae bacterium]|nr:ATP-dependent DNA ligase [Solirubrobacteraceae bacterium]
MRLAELAEASAAVAATPARNEKIAALAELLRRAGPDEVAPVVSWLSGELTQRQIGVGWALLRERPEALEDVAAATPGAPAASLTVADVESAFTAIGALGGPGSVAGRRAAVRDLFARATADEQAFLTRLLLGDLRQGALAGVMADAVAKAASAPAAEVRRALMLHGDLAAIAAIALVDGREGLAAVTLQVGRPLAPMLAGTAADIPAALEKIAPAAIDWKLDGARIQVHRNGDEVAIYTRTLDDVTDRLPEVVTVARALPAHAIVLDGEAIALRDDGRPEPFQVTAARFGTRKARSVPLASLFFDVLHVDGADLLDVPLTERTAVLERVVPAAHRIPRTVAGDAAAAQAAFDAAVAAGHEGVVVKALDAPYAAGRRGATWLKVKPVHTLDLVVLAAEWGHGRRRGKLSNLHLGARDEETGGWAMLGKTFKGLTDELLAWQTERLLALQTHREGIAVHVRPELVVEIAFDGVQTSPRYPSGMALRFARVKRYREDKTAAEADTLATVRAIRDR